MPPRSPRIKRKHLLLFASAFVSYFVIAPALQCYTRPLHATADTMEMINCNGTQQCYKRIGILPKHTFYIKGCIPTSFCGLIYSKDVHGVTVDFRTLCCNTQLCNGSFRMKASLTTNFVLVFGWVLWHL